MIGGALIVVGGMAPILDIFAKKRTDEGTPPDDVAAAEVQAQADTIR